MNLTELYLQLAEYLDQYDQQIDEDRANWKVNSNHRHPFMSSMVILNKIHSLSDEILLQQKIEDRENIINIILNGN